MRSVSIASDGSALVGGNHKVRPLRLSPSCSCARSHTHSYTLTPARTGCRLRLDDPARSGLHRPAAQDALPGALAVPDPGARLARYQVRPSCLPARAHLTDSTATGQATRDVLGRHDHQDLDADGLASLGGGRGTRGRWRRRHRGRDGVPARQGATGASAVGVGHGVQRRLGLPRQRCVPLFCPSP